MIDKLNALREGMQEVLDEIEVKFMNILKLEEIPLSYDLFVTYNFNFKTKVGSIVLRFKFDLGKTGMDGSYWNAFIRPLGLFLEKINQCRFQSAALTWGEGKYDNDLMCHIMDSKRFNTILELETKDEIDLFLRLTE